MKIIYLIGFIIGVYGLIYLIAIAFGMKVKLIFKWYDLWVGFFVDTKKKCLYVFPVPMVGLIIMRKGNWCENCKQPKSDSEMKGFNCCKKCDDTGVFIS